MARELYSIRMLASDSVTSEITAVVPDGFVWVVRDVRLFLRAAVAGGIIEVTANGIPIAGHQLEGGPEENDQVTGLEMRCVLLAGDVLGADCTTSGGVYVSGYQLTAP